MNGEVNIMEDLFQKEQQIYDLAVAHLEEIRDGEFCSVEQFKHLIESYGHMLRQFRKITKISDIGTKKLILHEMELYNQTIHDALTNLYNRRFLDDGLDSFVKASAEYKKTLSVMMIDVDFFKKYNDTYGHDMGDKCLRLIANTLNSSIRSGDGFVARYGGEEFTEALPHTDRNGAQVVAERMLQNVMDLGIPHEKSDVSNVVTISIGVTFGVSDGNLNANDYIKRADKALYYSKNNGRNLCTYLDLWG
jgi:diguanylate cyclase (GGDEF)-like protein